MPRKTLAERQKRHAGHTGRSVSFGQAAQAARSFGELHEAVSSPNGGFSRHLRTGEAPTSGIMVSQQEHTRDIPAEMPVTPRTLVGYARQKKGELTAPGMYFGGWRASTGRLALDVSEQHGTKRAAKKAMVREKQEAAYNIQTGQEIYNPHHPANEGMPVGKTGFYAPPTPRGTRSKQKRFKK